MTFTDPVFVGIDPTSGRKSFTYAVLDGDLRLLSLMDGEMEDVISFLSEYSSVTVAINSPSALNRGLVRAKMRKELGTLRQVRGAEMRLGEYELRERGIAVSGTPSTLQACPSWMQMGFDLYRNLEKIGYGKYSGNGSDHQFLETHPHACYCILADAIPQSKPSLEGRLQRQLILHERGVRLKDPMDFFEEITRHKMMKGIWPVELLYLPEQLDALVAAFTAWLVVNKTELTSSIGNEKEGMMFLPERELKEKY